MKKILFLFLLFFINKSNAQSNILRLWNGLAPGNESEVNNEIYENGRYKNVYQPEIFIYTIDQRNETTTSIIIFPGGGYTHVTFEKEGTKIARWLNEHGINAFVLKYRLNEKLALIDAQRAVSLVKSKAKELNINPDKIGVMGFSAGGHLAANMLINEKKYFNDNIDSISCFPNFVVLIYPWLQDLYKKLKDDFQPTFIIHASDDKRVPVEQSINFYNELLKRNISVEMHIYDKGGHGFGMEEERGRVSYWGNIFLDWLRAIGY